MLKTQLPTEITNQVGQLTVEALTDLIISHYPKMNTKIAKVIARRLKETHTKG